MNLVEAMQELEGLKNLHAIWSEVLDHLDSFVDTDVALAKAGIAVEQGSARLVPQGVISDVMRIIAVEKIVPISARILNLEQLRVAEDKHERNVPKGGQKEKEAAKKRTPNGPRIARPPGQA